MAQGLRDAPVVRSGYGCNNACRFCSQGQWRETLGDRPAEEVHAEILDAARTAAQDHGVVILSGGEITLREELPAWIQTAHRHGARRVLVQTNGRMLAYRKLVRRLKTSGCDMIAVALHGPRAEVHEWLTRAPGSFEQTLVGLRNARSEGMTLHVNTVVTRSNFRHLAELAAILPRHGVAGWRLIWARPEGEGERLAPSIVPSAVIARPYVLSAIEVARRLGRRVSFEGPSLSEESTDVVRAPS